MNIHKPNKQKPDKKIAPIDRQRKIIGEFHNKETQKVREKQPLKITEMDFMSGSDTFKTIGTVVLVISLVILVAAVYNSWAT
jgi:hypothetical protein